jgi:hypothetical protein
MTFLEGDKNTLNRLGTVLQTASDAGKNRTQEEVYNFSLSAYEEGIENLAPVIPAVVKMGKYRNFMRVSDAGFIIADRCRKAKDKFFTLIDSQFSALQKAQSAVKFDVMPRCFSGNVSDWNEKINKNFAACNNINVLYAKLSGDCQLNAPASDCTGIINARVSPCEKYTAYLGYTFSALLILSGVLFFAAGMSVSAVIMVLSSLLIFASGLLGGLISGWAGILGSGLGFMSALFNGIKGIIVFYGGS